MTAADKELAELIAAGRREPNIRIEYGCAAPPRDGSKYAAVYVSSDACFHPDTPEAYRKKILQRDNYEWFTTRFRRAEKHIFIRDITKCSFFDGINDETDSIPKLIELLRRETAGYKVLTIGSSAGGFLAPVIGIALKAEVVFDFCGAFKLPDDFVEKLRGKCRNPEAMKYADTRQIYLDNREVPVFYMTSSLSPFDIEQMNHVRNFDTLRFAVIKTARHGVPVFKNVLEKIMDSPLEELEKIYVHPVGSPVSEYEFIRRHWGFPGVLARSLSYLKRHPGALFKREFYGFFSD